MIVAGIGETDHVESITYRLSFGTLVVDQDMVSLVHAARAKSCKFPSITSLETINHIAFETPFIKTYSSVRDCNVV